MKIQILSDIHLEFVKKITLIIDKMSEADVDITVIAGDLITGHNDGKMYTNIIEELSRCFSHPVLIVPGNHDYYSSSIKEMDRVFSRIKSENIYILNRKTVNIDGINFIGATGWWNKIPPFNIVKYINDFEYIKDLKSLDFGSQIGLKDKKFFEEELEKLKGEKVVCISHIAPCHYSIHPKFIGDRVNFFFNSNYFGLIKRYQPLLWVHGHTHESFDYFIDDTRVVCNPMGYPKPYDENKSFDFHKNIVI